MVKRLQIILILVLAALMASPVAGGFAVAVSHGATALDHGHDHGHDHDFDELSDVEMPNGNAPKDGHGKGHDASDHVPGNLLPEHQHTTISFSPVKSGRTLKASKAFNQPPLERPPRLYTRD